jgi:hypothetical protein
MSLCEGAAGNHRMAAYATRAKVSLDLHLFNSRFVPLPLHGMPPVPLLSKCMHASDLAIEAPLLHSLQCEAAKLVMERIVHRPETLAVIRPQGNSPLAEVLFNTKVSMQFSRCTSINSSMGASSTGAQVAICEGCMGREVEEEALLLSRCVCGGLKGCSACVGKLLVCPRCEQSFTREWTYETGSGRSSIGRDIKR